MNQRNSLKANIEEALLGARGLINDFSPEGQQKFEEYLQQAKLYKEALIIMEQEQSEAEQDAWAATQDAPTDDQVTDSINASRFPGLDGPGDDYE